MNGNKYEKMISIINQDDYTVKDTNEVIELLIQTELTDIKKEHYTILDDFICLVARYKLTNETKNNLLDKPLDYIRSKIYNLNN